MKIKNIISTFLVTGALLLGGMSVMQMREPVIAQSSWGSSDQIKTPATQDCDGSKDPVNCLKKPGTESSKIWNILTLLLNILSGAIGVAAVIMLIAGGIQYSTAGGDPSAVTAAKKKISNVLLALAAYVFMYSFLQWLIPGGIFL